MKSSKEEDGSHESRTVVVDKNDWPHKEARALAVSVYTIHVGSA